MRAPIAVALGALLSACASRAPTSITTHTTSAELHGLPPMIEEEPLFIGATPPVEWAPVDHWRARHPGSAELLDDWRARHPLVAAHLARWGGREPEKLQVLVEWSMTNPDAPIGSFFLTRSGWDDLSNLSERAPEAVEAFLHWARASGPAAEELVAHPGALSSVDRAR